MLSSHNSSSFHVEVVVPAKVPEKERPAFEQAMVAFLFGHDRIRSELEPALKARGVDIKRLASLSGPEPLGVCPVPGALEFIPTPRLAKLALEKGISLTDGGRIHLSFNYEKYAHRASTEKALEVNLGLPDAFAKEDSISEDDVSGVTRALFGDCQLAQRAQAYLLAHGVDLVEIAATHKAELRNGMIPPTTRVRPEVAQILQAHGFNTDTIGQLKVKGNITALVKDDAAWSKTTCC